MIFMFDIIAHILFIGNVQCLCASCIYILCLYSVFFQLFLFYSIILLAYFSSVSMHAPLCATSSLTIRLERSILGSQYIFGGTYQFMRDPILFLPPSSFLFFPSSKSCSLQSAADSDALRFCTFQDCFYFF